MGGEDGWDGGLEAIINTSCPVIWSGGLIVSLGVSKTMALATMSQQAHACILRAEKLITFNMTCMWHLIQIHFCMGICFS